MGRLWFAILNTTTDSQQKNQNRPLNIDSDSSVEKWRIASYDQLPRLQSILHFLQEAAAARSQFISAGGGDSDLTPPLRLRSIFACFGGNPGLFLPANSCRMQQRLHGFWVHSLFIYLLLHNNDYFGDIPVLLYYNYFKPTNFSEVFKPTTFHTLCLKKATSFSCFHLIK